MNISYDNEAGTLYWYFVDLTEGDAVEEYECPVSLLCDARGGVVGFQLDLSEDTDTATPPSIIRSPSCIASDGAR